MIYPFILAIALIATPPAIAAPEEDSAPRANTTFLNGHNGSITSDTLKPGHCSIGFDSLGCGVTDRISIGGSPWLFRSYNMYSFAMRTLLSQDQEGNRWALQVSYFKTFPSDRLGAYNMESVWGMLIRTLNIAPHYRLHFNFHTNYYWNEKMPFSLRRPYLKKTPWQFNFTLLHEVELVHGWFIFGEVGLWDMARAPLHIQGGASIGKVWRHFSFHFGYSLTAALSAIENTGRVDYQQYLRSTWRTYDDPLDPYLVKSDYALHPEMSFQFMF